MFDLIWRWLSWSGQPSEEATPSLLGLDPSSGGTGFSPDPEVDERLRLCLAAMPVIAREVYLLRMIDHMPIDRIAIRLAIPREAVVRNLRNALRVLNVDARP
jgi:DNA-directed RNA polymerase specialized sigma24 family protein